MKDANELRNALEQFCGTDGYHFNPLYRKMNYTDGVKFFAETAGGGAYWFLDIVGTEYFPKQNPEDPFMLITLRVAGGSAIIECSDGNDNELVPDKVIHMTDCPEGDWKFYLEGDVLLLPGEH